MASKRFGVVPSSITGTSGQVLRVKADESGFEFVSPGDVSGLVGPTGPQGDLGPTGPEGLMGPTGSTGSVSSIGTIDSQTKSANGAALVSGVLYMQSADATYPGLVTTGSQTFAGNKTFNGEIKFVTKVGFFNTAPVSQPTGYAVTNVTTDRAYDADITSIDELADVLGTLIADLKAFGLLGS